MNRLETLDRLLELHLEENESGKYAHSKEYEDCREAIENLLTDIKDIEEEIGIDLITFYRLHAKAKIYFENKTCRILQILEDCIVVKDVDKKKYLPFKDYGKTWALTREELESKK